MSDITFDESKYRIKSRAMLGAYEIPFMIKFLLNKGIVKSEKQAFGILIAIMIISISVGVFIIYNSFFKVPEVPPMTIEEEILFEQLR